MIIENPLILKPVILLLGSPDDFISLEAARSMCVIRKYSIAFILDIIFRQANILYYDQDLLRWTYVNLTHHGEKEHRCLGATFFLQIFLQLPEFRTIFFERDNAINMHIIVLSKFY